MSRKTAVLFSIVIALVCLCMASICTAISGGFIPMLNGNDLTGWEQIGAQTWSVHDGVLYVTKGGTGWLKSTKQYKDFDLELEYKLEKGSNSGVFLRALREGNPAFSGMEIQMLDDFGKKPNIHSTGALYDAVAPSVNATKPAGEWNHYQILLKGNRLTVRLNGKRIIRVNLADHALNARLADELKFDKRAQVGFIGLQAYDNPVQYRNIRIREL
jgi:hypothetical protein